MLGVRVMLAVISVALHLPGNSALYNNQLTGRSRRQDLLLNPFKSAFKRAICAAGKKFVSKNCHVQFSTKDYTSFRCAL